MNTISSGALSFDRDQEEERKEVDKPMEKTTTPGGDKETKWKVVATTAGLAPAEIIAQRLQAEGIPARAWQEGAGQAFGLTVGLLGNGYVVVPEPYVEEAEELLASSIDEDNADEEADYGMIDEESGV
ncbi:MAG: hypothetical protein AMJ56_07250 [Anaerolineae bacterium SG8_19]|jgi:hypothetical protein|nr:MAG: hypothetical protein AMJ56_07250 [Anaerolineae bacterium SG8_19]